MFRKGQEKIPGFKSIERDRKYNTTEGKYKTYIAFSRRA